jgi:hypothetical protein
MPSSGLRGSFPLTTSGISNNVTATSAGAYALGEVRASDSMFVISRVGRSDNDVAERLGDYIGQYKRFKFEYYPSAKAAFEKECRLYHDFEPPDNKIHPDRPNGSGWECPVCTIFD